MSASNKLFPSASSSSIHRLAMMVTMGATLLFLFAGTCHAQRRVGGNVIVRSTPSRKPIARPARYQCAFTNLWTRARHPVQYPGNRASWSPPILASHSDRYSMWVLGGFATPGFRQVAETGETRVIRREIARAGRAVADSVIGRETFNSRTNRQVLPTIVIDRNRPFLSGATMVAPSPDWITGFSRFRAHNGRVWFSRIIINTFPFDAGTENGNTYSLNNRPTRPQGRITRFTTRSVPRSGIFLNPEGDNIFAVGRWTCNLLN